MDIRKSRIQGALDVRNHNVDVEVYRQVELLGLKNTILMQVGVVTNGTTHNFMDIACEAEEELFNEYINALALGDGKRLLEAIRAIDETSAMLIGYQHRTMLRAIAMDNPDLARKFNDATYQMDFDGEHPEKYYSKEAKMRLQETVDKLIQGMSFVGSAIFIAAMLFMMTN